MGYVVGFHSIRGGPGKTFLLGAIAYQLQKKEKKIILIDFDLAAPSFCTIFGLDLSNTKTLNRYLASREVRTIADFPLSETIVKCEFLDRTIDVIFSSPKPNDIQPVFFGSQEYVDSMGRKARELIADLLSNGYDYILLDGNPGFTYPSQWVMSSSDILLEILRDRAFEFRQVLDREQNESMLTKLTSKRRFALVINQAQRENITFEEDFSPLEKYKKFVIPFNQTLRENEISSIGTRFVLAVKALERSTQAITDWILNS